MIFTQFFTRLFQLQHQSYPHTQYALSSVSNDYMYDIIQKYCFHSSNNQTQENVNTSYFHHLQNLTMMRKSYMTGYDERFYFDKIDFEEPSLEEIMKNNLQFDLLKQLYQNISIIEKLDIINKYTRDIIIIYNITKGGLYDDWLNIF